MPRRLNILVASSEVHPFAKTGGLADVCGALPKALARLGHQVRVMLPRYRCVDRPRGPARDLALRFSVPVGSQALEAGVFEHSLDGEVPAWFIDNEFLFDREFLYGPPGGAYPDNAARFVFFCRAVLEACKALDFPPHIIHCNDWQTGLVPVYLKTRYATDPFFEGARTVFSIHNLGYQGNFPAQTLTLAHLPADLFHPDGVEFYGEFNFLKSGLVFADKLTTVSKTYSREILKPEFGFKLEGVLRHRAGDLFGIVNGIDYEEWNPARDPWIAHPYNARNFIKGKAACRQVLVKTLRMRLERTTPLFCLLTRLTYQKGIDLIQAALPDLFEAGAALAVVGSGEPRYEEFFRSQAGDRLGVFIGFDEPLAHRLLAGSDFLLMPSVYEPCGLTQMQAMKYGTVPLVSAVGGLRDTVRPFSPRSGKGLGFQFAPGDLQSFRSALSRALKTYRTPAAWKRVVRNCLAADFSWDRAARAYLRVYRRALRH